MNNNIFRYKVIGDNKNLNESIKKMCEELNNGLSFFITQNDEKIINLSGSWKGWATTKIDKNGICINIRDDFFSSSCIFYQILTSLWGNLLDFGNIKFEDFQLSDKIHNLLLSNNSSNQNMKYILTKDGPYFGTIFKPMYGLSLEDKLNIAENFARIGGVFIKEDETYFREKDEILKEAEVIQNKINSISNHCYYIPNVTPYISDDDFLERIYNVGIRVAMINYLISGLPSVYQSLQKNDKLLFWGHRVGFKSIEKFVSMKVITLLAAYCGINMIHIGTPIFSDNDSVVECLNINRSLNKVNFNALPVFSKVSLDIVPDLIRVYGNNIILMASGSIRTKGSLDWEKMKKLIDICKITKS